MRRVVEEGIEGTSVQEAAAAFAHSLVRSDLRDALLREFTAVVQVCQVFPPSIRLDVGAIAFNYVFRLPPPYPQPLRFVIAQWLVRFPLACWGRRDAAKRLPELSLMFEPR
jgi:hypothetical protein